MSAVGCGQSKNHAATARRQRRENGRVYHKKKGKRTDRGADYAWWSQCEIRRSVGAGCEFHEAVG